jgi:hypothetical protein
MKTVLKLFLALIILIILSIASFLLIFNFGMNSGALVAILLIFICFLLFCLSIFGLVIGSLNFIKLRNRTELVGLMILSIFLTLLISAGGFVNAVIEKGLEGTKPGLEEKVRFIASTLFQVPSQKNLVKEEKDGVTYLFPSGNEDQVKNMDALINEELANFDTLFGDVDSTKLQIEMHNDTASLKAPTFMEDARGYYSSVNQTIHLAPLGEDWSYTLLHEYTHYRIHQFSKIHDLPLTRIPQWFQEGVSEYIGDNDRHFNLKVLKTVDFHLLDSNKGFHQTLNQDFDPYLQSYLAVELLVKEHNLEIIPELLLSETREEFYQNLEEVTKKSVVEFQQSFINDLIADREQTNEKFILANKAIEEKQYEQAEIILADIKGNGSKYDIELADSYYHSIYIDQGLYEEATIQLEDKIVRDDDWSKISDLVLLAETYLLVDTQKSLDTIKIVKDEVSDNHFIAQNINQFVEAYQKINSDNALAGYKMLFDEELIRNKKLEEDLYEKLLIEYPGQF